MLACRSRQVQIGREKKKVSLGRGERRKWEGGRVYQTSVRPGGNRRSSRILSSQPQDTPTPKEPAAARIVSERSGAEAGGKRRPRAWLCQPGSITCRPFLASLGISERHARGKGAPQSDQEKIGLITEEGKKHKKKPSTKRIQTASLLIYLREEILRHSHIFSSIR